MRFLFSILTIVGIAFTIFAIGTAIKYAKTLFVEVLFWIMAGYLIIMTILCGILAYYGRVIL